MINIKNLNLSFKGKKLLNNINLTLQDKKTLFILGKSGSGKSLFAKSLIKLFDKNYILSADCLNIDNQNILNLKDKDLRKFRGKVSLIFQNNNIYPLLDIGSYFNIILKTHTNLNKKQRKELVFYYLDMLGFKDLDLIYHSYVHQLSIGMIKRIEICSSLLCGAKYLICDEITSSLDKENEELVINIIKKLKNNISIIFITHDLKFLNLADEFALFENGKIIANCKKDEIFENKNFKNMIDIYKEFYA